MSRKKGTPNNFLRSGSLTYDRVHFVSRPFLCTLLQKRFEGVLTPYVYTRRWFYFASSFEDCPNLFGDGRTLQSGYVWRIPVGDAPRSFNRFLFGGFAAPDVGEYCCRLVVPFEISR